MPTIERSRRSDLVFVFAIVVLLYACWVIRGTLLLIYLSVLFAIIFIPALHWVQRIHIGGWKPSRGASVLILFACGIVIVGLLVITIVPPIANDLQGLTKDLPAQVEQLSSRIRQLPFGQKLASHLKPATVTNYIAGLLGKVISSFAAVANGLFNFLLVIIMIAYFMLNGPRSFDWAMSLVPANKRERLRPTLQRAATRAQKWLTGQVLLMLILGSLTAIALGFMHVRYFYALAVFAGLANFIPVVGPIATVIVAGMVAALDSWLKVLGVMIFYFVYQQVENAYLSPRIMKASVGLLPMVVIVALAIGGALAGILGALIAVPTAAIIATVLNEYLVHKDT